MLLVVDTTSVRIAEVTRYTSCSSTSPCPSGKSCCGGMCVDKVINTFMKLTCCAGVVCYSDEEYTYACAIDSLNPTTKVCCGAGATYTKNGRQYCCSPGHSYQNGQCVSLYYSYI
jgi:hypothetical protein